MKRLARRGVAVDLDRPIATNSSTAFNFSDPRVESAVDNVKPPFGCLLLLDWRQHLHGGMNKVEKSNLIRPSVPGRGNFRLSCAAFTV